MVEDELFEERTETGVSVYGLTSGGLSQHCVPHFSTLRYTLLSSVLCFLALTVRRCEIASVTDS